MSTQIHETAVVAPGAELGEDVSIGPYSLIGPRVRIGDRTRIGPQVVIDGVTRIGCDNQIIGQASIGAVPQDLTYEDEPTMVELGDRNAVREFVTINRGTVKGGGVTRIGNDCLLMACCHVAHDCQLDDGVLLANNVLLAGHVKVGERAILNGAAAAHQFVTVGRQAYVGGLTRLVHDVPPFMIVEGHPARVRKVNVVGLERAERSREEIDAVRAAFRRIFRSGEPRQRVLSEIEQSEMSPLVDELVQSLRRTEIGYSGRYRESLREEFLRSGERLLEVSPS